MSKFPWQRNYLVKLTFITLQVKLYLKGDKDFCSTAADGKYAVIGIVRVPPNDARSVAVPIVPKRIGEIFLEVSSIFQVKDHGSYVNSAGDTVIRKLLVVVRALKIFIIMINH